MFVHVKFTHMWGVGEVWCVQGLHQGVEIVQGVAAPGLHVYTEPALMLFEPEIRRQMRHATWPRGCAALRRSPGSHPLSLKIASDWPCCLLDGDENDHLLSWKKKHLKLLWEFETFSMLIIAAFSCVFWSLLYLLMRTKCPHRELKIGIRSLGGRGWFGMCLEYLKNDIDFKHFLMLLIS